VSPESLPVEEKISSQYLNKTVILNGESLSIEDVLKVSRQKSSVELTLNPKVWEKVDSSCHFIKKSLEDKRAIYGVNTGFGGMANLAISATFIHDLQTNLLHFTKAGAGPLLPIEDVRASMLIRCNSHLKGASGIRRIIIERFQLFLNEHVTPHVRCLGSIGASGDLIPLANISGSILGLNRTFTVDFQGKTLNCLSALKRLNLKPLKLFPKEGLAMINGTSVMTGIAANCVYDAKRVLALSFACHAFFFQALRASNQSFHTFIHEMKPHRGQKFSASVMAELLEGSQMIHDEIREKRVHISGELIQDRYSLRCLPQYLGPIVDGIRTISDQVEIEINSATDNPLIDVNSAEYYHGGNFLGQYIGMGMDQLRYYLSLLVKHLDIQISLLVTPEFSMGLSPSLVGNTHNKVNMGLKGLQICANSITPLIQQMAGTLADKFPSYAEQFNQNLNSQGFGSANLARSSINLCWEFMAISLLFSVQAVELRAKEISGYYDATPLLSKNTQSLYLKTKAVLGSACSKERPLIWNDKDQALESFIEKLSSHLRNDDHFFKSISSIIERI